MLRRSTLLFVMFVNKTGGSHGASMLNLIFLESGSSYGANKVQGKKVQHEWDWSNNASYNHADFQEVLMCSDLPLLKDRLDIQGRDHTNRLFFLFNPTIQKSEDMGWFYLNLLSSSWIYLRRFYSLGHLSESVNNFLRLKRSCCFLFSNSFAKRSLSLRSAAAFSNFNRVVGMLLCPKLRSGTLSAFWLNSYMLSQSIIGLRTLRSLRKTLRSLRY